MISDEFHDKMSILINYGTMVLDRGKPWPSPSSTPRIMVLITWRPKGAAVFKGRLLKQGRH
jgi:hypothetical protein